MFWHCFALDNKINKNALWHHVPLSSTTIVKWRIPILKLNSYLFSVTSSLLHWSKTSSINRMAFGKAFSSILNTCTAPKNFCRRRLVVLLGKETLMRPAKILYNRCRSFVYLDANKSMSFCFDWFIFYGLPIFCSLFKAIKYFRL